MKYTTQTLLGIVLLFSTVAFSQTPEGLNYQAIARNSAGEALGNTTLGMQISILVGSVDGTSVYSETHQVTANSFGLFKLIIGEGASSDDFSAIDWGANNHFVKIEMDVNGGTDYSDFGTSQLLSVPYALYAKKAEIFTGTIAETDPVFATSVAAAITAEDTTNWYNPATVNESDPVFDTSIASGITGSDTTAWNNKLSVENDPVFGGSIAAGITGTDTTSWNNKLASYTETDPIFGTSLAIGITETDTANWNSKPDAFSETDPLFGTSIASGITGSDTIAWNNKLSIENDPVFGGSIAAGITGTDTTNWNNKLDSYVETQNLSNVLAINNTANTQIKEVTDPTEAQDAATKGYVDQLLNLVNQMQGQIDDLEIFTGVQQLTDIDGNNYLMVRIGDQIWMKENLIVTQYADGTTISGVYAYDNNEAIAKEYGRLYTWDATMDVSGSNSTYSSGIQGVCPTDWHVPSDDEWKDLERYLGMSESEVNLINVYRGTTEGGKLKEAGLTHWDIPDEGATNESGFTALASGYKIFDGPGYYAKGNAAFFWLSDQATAGNGVSRSLNASISTIARIDAHDKMYGFSVRCLKDNFDPNLLLWNKLGSEFEIGRSVIGDNGEIIGSDYVFEPGQYLNGYVRTAGGSNSVHFPASILQNLKHKGSVELWINPKVSNPVPYSYGVFALLGNVFGTNSHVYVAWGDGTSGTGIYGGVNFDGTMHFTPFEASQFVATPGEPFHVAISWNNEGIDGTTNTLRIYRDGVLIGSSDEIWDADNTTTNYDGFTLGMGPDGGGYNKFIVDNIKVWNYSKTDFSDRTRE